GLAVAVRLVREEEGLARRRVRLLVLLDRALQPHLRLLLVRDDVGGLLGQTAVLLLRFLDRLLELDLRVSRFLELPRELGAQVLPPPPDRFPHMERILRRARGGRPPARLAGLVECAPERLHLTHEVVDVATETRQRGGGLARAA